jgi:hypothetical protein
VPERFSAALNDRRGRTFLCASHSPYLPCGTPRKCLQSGRTVALRSPYLYCIASGGRTPAPVPRPARHPHSPWRDSRTTCRRHRAIAAPATACSPVPPAGLPILRLSCRPTVMSLGSRVPSCNPAQGLEASQCRKHAHRVALDEPGRVPVPMSLSCGMAAAGFSLTSR